MKINHLIMLFVLVGLGSVQAQKKSFASLKSAIKKDNEKQKAEDPHAQAVALYFKDRPSTAGADVASPKENVIPKKESFKDKIKRYESDGYKMGVAFYSGPIMTKAVPPAGTETGPTKQLALKGSLEPMDDELLDLAKDFIAKMNKAYNTDVFEVVDLKKIPVRSVLGNPSDDWNATKYKTVFGYTVTPEFDYNKSMGKYNGDFIINIFVTAMEYYPKKGKPKMSIVLGGKSLGAHRVNYSDETLSKITTVAELNALVNPPSPAELHDMLLEQQDTNFTKITDKLNK